jgi:hypothetical protein
LEGNLEDCQTILALDNHSECGGLRDLLLNVLMLSGALRDEKLIKFAVLNMPLAAPLRKRYPTTN